MNALQLLAKISHEGVRASGSSLPNELPRFKTLARLLIQKGWAVERDGRYFATKSGQAVLKAIGGTDERN